MYSPHLIVNERPMIADRRSASRFPLEHLDDLIEILVELVDRK
tara:strand:- start:2803 stop:2931 length:129 start_codon:yes stop_codon:yes gene_type:complete